MPADHHSHGPLVSVPAGAALVAHDAPPRRDAVLERVAVAAVTVAAELDVALLNGDLDADLVIAHRNLSRALGQLRAAAPRRRRAKKTLPGGPRPVPTSDARGYKRASSTLPGTYAGRTPASKGRKYDPDPPTPAEVFALMRACAETPAGHRTRALMATLYRTGLRIHEALLLEERDLDAQRGSIVVRRGKGGKRGIVGMDPWGWTQLAPWLEERQRYPHGPIFCVVEGPTAGKRAWSQGDVRRAFHKLAESIDLRKRIAPHQFRHAHAVELVRENLPAHVLQRQLRHSNMGVTTTYLASIDQDEIVSALHERRPPMLAVADLQDVLRVR